MKLYKIYVSSNFDIDLSKDIIINLANKHGLNLTLYYNTGLFNNQIEVVNFTVEILDYCEKIEVIKNFISDLKTDLKQNSVLLVHYLVNSELI